MPTKSERKPDLLVSLSAQELAKVKPLSDERIRGALDEGKRDRDAAATPAQQSTINTRTLFN